MAAKFYLDKYNLSLKKTKDENDSLKTEIEALKKIRDENTILKLDIETLKKKESIYNNKMLYTYARFHEYKKDIENALKYYKLAADQGHLLSQCQIVALYQYKNDIENAKKYLALAANNTQTISGHIYDIEDYIRIDSEAILRCYTPFADKGNIMFQCIIAIIYKYKNDIENAKKYFKLSADQGFVPTIEILEEEKSEQEKKEDKSEIVENNLKRKYDTTNTETILNVLNVNNTDNANKRLKVEDDDSNDSDDEDDKVTIIIFNDSDDEDVIVID
jgi:TPR repeat protein